MYLRCGKTKKNQEPCTTYQHRLLDVNSKKCVKIFYVYVIFLLKSVYMLLENSKKLRALHDSPTKVSRCEFIKVCQNLSCLLNFSVKKRIYVVGKLKKHSEPCTTYRKVLLSAPLSSLLIFLDYRSCPILLSCCFASVPRAL